MATIIAPTGRQAHDARGCMSGELGRKLRLTMASKKAGSSLLYPHNQVET